MAIVATRQIGSECHLVAELRTSARPLQAFVTDVNNALRCICHENTHQPLKTTDQKKIGLDEPRSGLKIRV